MRPGWLRKLFHYSVLMAPTLLLCGVLGIFGLAVWVSAILKDPARLDDAPGFVRKFSQSVYWLHRTHWHTVRDCVQFDTTLLYKPRSGSCVFSNAEFSTQMHFDERTLRQTSAPRVDGQSAVGRGSRVLILGDSHSMGWGVEDDETYASVLAAEHGFETLNLAVSSYGTARELLRLRQTGVLQDADIILIQYCENDLEENRHFLAQGSMRDYTPADFDALLAYKPPPSDALNVAASLLRIVGGDIAKNLEHLAPASGAAGDRPASPAAVFLGVLERFEELRNHRIIVVEINGFGYTTSFAGDVAAQASAKVAVVTTGLAAPDFYRMDDHLTAAGHRKLAARLAQALRQGS